jgi:hypothetical protein
MASITRQYQFVVFMNDEEKAQLYSMAGDDGTTASALVRAVLAAEWKRRQGRAPRRTPKR